MKRIIWTAVLVVVLIVVVSAISVSVYENGLRNSGPSDLDIKLALMKNGNLVQILSIHTLHESPSLKIVSAIVRNNTGDFLDEGKIFVCYSEDERAKCYEAGWTPPTGYRGGNVTK